MEKISQFRLTKAIINLQAIQQNVLNLKRFLQPAVEIIAVVKANAYGHGDVAVAASALEAGATILAVATPDEAVHMRHHFPKTDILVLGASPLSFLPFASEHNILVTAFSAEWIQQASEFNLDCPVKIHIKVDSGMGRIGVGSQEELLAVYEALEASANFEIDGIFTHFATADEENSLYFDNQMNKFKLLLSLLPKKPRLVHIANTATALTKQPDLQYDAVRYGISMYGLAPSSYVAGILPFPLVPALSLETELVHVKRIKAGQSVGYGAAFTAQEDCYVGTLPIGYADGMIRQLSGQNVIIEGVLCPIIGRICMDQCMILMPKAFPVGSKVTLIGHNGAQSVTIDDWAEKLNTINYEVPCILTARVPRVYQS